MKISEVIRKYRREAGLTQEQVANYLGVTAPAVNKWENGISYPDVLTLAPLARILGINVDTLLSFDAELSPEEINRLISELTEMGQKEGMEKTFERGEELIKTYSGCDMLMMSVAQILDMFRTVWTVDAVQAEKIEKKINSWYELMAKSKDASVAMLAKISLMNRYMGTEEYGKAQQILDDIPPVSYDKRFSQATLYWKQGREDEAYEIYESIIYQGITQVRAVLTALMEKKLNGGRYDEAERYGSILKETAKLFELGAYMEKMSDFYIALAKKEKEEALNALEIMMSSLDSLGVKKESMLYSHIKPKGEDKEHTVKMFRYMFRQVFERDEELELLRGEKRFQRLKKALEQKLDVPAE